MTGWLLCGTTAGMAARKNYHHGNLRDALVEAARDVLTARGEEGLSLREVARAAGVSPAAPYHHFKTKEELLAAVVVSGFHETYLAMKDAQAVASPDPNDQLVAVGLGYIIFAVRHPAVFKLMFRRMDVAEQTLARIKDDTMNTGKALYDALAAVHQAKGLRRDVEVDAHLCWSVVHGLSMLYIEGVLVEQDPIKHARDVLVRLMGSF